MKSSERLVAIELEKELWKKVASYAIKHETTRKVVVIKALTAFLESEGES